MSSSISTALKSIVVSTTAPSQPDGTQEVQFATKCVLTNVPWIKFKVQAEPDLELFKTDPKLQQALTQISQLVATSIAQIITTEFTSLTQTLTTTITPKISTTIVEVVQQLVTASAVTDCCTVTHTSTEACPLTIPCTPNCGGKPCGPVTATKPPSLPDLGTATWIWTKEANTGNPPPGARPFRKTLTPKVPVDSLIIDVICDDHYTLYVNGYLVGSGLTLSSSQRYRVAFYPTCKVVIAIYGVQSAVHLGVAGVLASAVTWNSALSDANPSTFITDASWKTVATPNFPTNFIAPCFDDSTWDNATVEAFGAAPKPTGYTPQNPGLTQLPGGIPDAPKADPATVLTE